MLYYIYIKNLVENYVKALPAPVPRRTGERRAERLCEARSRRASWPEWRVSTAFPVVSPLNATQLFLDRVYASFETTLVKMMPLRGESDKYSMDKYAQVYPKRMENGSNSMNDKLSTRLESF